MMKGGDQSAFILDNIIGNHYDDINTAMVRNEALRQEYTNITGDEWSEIKSIVKGKINELNDADDTEALDALLELIKNNW